MSLVLLHPLPLLVADDLLQSRLRLLFFILVVFIHYHIYLVIQRSSEYSRLPIYYIVNAKHCLYNRYSYKIDGIQSFK